MNIQTKIKTIFKIAANELRLMFVSPIAWLILVIFVLMSGLAFCNMLERVLTWKAQGYSLQDLSADLISGYLGVFSRMSEHLYLYIPLLTMGIMSRELNSGSVKLLFSSPVTNRQIIFGKYLALMMYMLVLIGSLTLIVLFAGHIVKDFDVNMTLAGFLALYLLVCTYAAIGLFMSSLTSYQMVAAVSTLAMLAGLNLMKNVGQELEWMRDITYWISLSGRTSEMMEGLICSEDVIYFLIVIAMFLSLSIVRLNLQRSSHNIFVATGKYCFVIAIALCIGYISSRPGMMFFHDATQMKSLTLTPNSQEVMKKMDGGLTITTYANPLGNNFFDAQPHNFNNDIRRFKQYVRFKPEIKMNYVYYYHHADNPTLEQQYPKLNDEERFKQVLRSYRMNEKKFLTPDAIDTTIDLSGEDYNLVRLIERENGKKTFLRMYNDMIRHPSEREITAAMKRLVVAPPMVSFLTGHREADIYSSGDDDYSVFGKNLTFRYSLVNQGFDTDTLSLSDSSSTLSNTDILVIGNPKSAFSETELAALKQYINEGKNLIIAAKSGKEQFLKPLTDMIGIGFAEGVLVCDDSDFAPDLLLCNITPDAAQLSGTFNFLRNMGFQITSPGTKALTFTPKDGFNAMPVVVAPDSACWNEMSSTDFVNIEPKQDAPGETMMNGAPVIAAVFREINGNIQKIAVFGNSDILANSELSRSRDKVKSGNFNLVLGFFEWFTGGDFPVNTGRPNGPDTEIALLLSSMWWVRVLFIWIIPGLLLIGGVLVWIRRGSN
ncbi:MAG: Gldg family protein [Dysgonamonadaceae bacterium]|jgi:ABC-2 type transport system permease protein|nr:Gldg family protein [Dysgonamonadaceae bacterium]